MKQPSEQDIQDYLNGLNRLHQSWSGSTESAMAKQRGMTNYLQWFKDRNIAISEDPYDHVWKLNAGQEEKMLL